MCVLPIFPVLGLPRTSLKSYIECGKKSPARCMIFTTSRMVVSAHGMDDNVIEEASRL
jgi:hypothetical protein